METKILELTGNDMMVSAGRDMISLCARQENCADRRDLGGVLLTMVLFPLGIVVLVTTNETVGVQHGLTRVTFVCSCHGPHARRALRLRVAAPRLPAARLHLRQRQLLHARPCLVDPADPDTGVVRGDEPQSGRVDEWVGEAWTASFFVEKLLPVSFVSLIFGRSTELSYRRLFVAERAVEEQRELLSENAASPKACFSRRCHP